MVKACLLTHAYDTVIRYSFFYDVLTRFKIFKGASTQNDNISASPMCGAYHDTTMCTVTLSSGVRELNFDLILYLFSTLLFLSLSVSY